DQYASATGDISEERPESVISGRRVEEVGQPSKGVTKQWFTPVERELEKHGMKAPGRVAMPKHVEPMLATLAEHAFDNDDWLFELKLDGIRAIVVRDGEKLDMWTRNAKSMTNR